MAWLFDRLPEDPLTTLSIGAAIFNTLVTLVIINWAITKKNESNVAKVESGAKKSSYVSKGWQNPSKETCSETGIADLVNLSKKLTAQVDKDNKEKQANRLSKRKENNISGVVESQMKSLQLQAGIYLDITTPEDLLLNEAAEVLKKYDTKE